MRKLDYQTIKDAVKELTIAANYDLETDVFRYLQKAKNQENTSIAKTIITEILENSEIASKLRIPICQDTGIVVVFLEVGNQVSFDFLIEEAINEGVKEAYSEESFRMSVVKHPIERSNTFTNTPCIIHQENVIGDKVKITVCPKGAGSENLSQLKMLLPGDGIDGVIKFVLDAVNNAGGKVCPPMIVGVGIGGNFEHAAYLSKKALIRPLDDSSNDEIAESLEQKLFQEINKLDIGPMGIGGETTALAVKVNVQSCHIASLPVAVNFQCHASRHKEVVI